LLVVVAEEVTMELVAVLVAIKKTHSPMVSPHLQLLLALVVPVVLELLVALVVVTQYLALLPLLEVVVVVLAL
jgi:hypothetical protein